MKIAVEELQQFISRDDWSRDQKIEVTKRDKSRVYGVATKTSTLDDVTITYKELYEYDEDDSKSFVAGSEELKCDTWSISGLTVLTKENAEMYKCAIAERLLSIFRMIDYSELPIFALDEHESESEEEEVGDIAAVVTTIVELDKGNKVRFNGVLLAKVSSYNLTLLFNTWTELRLYRTVSGNYVCQRVYCAYFGFGAERYSGKVCESMQEVKAYFGDGRLANKLYDSIDTDACTFIT